jgi:hypothetical protein
MRAVGMGRGARAASGGESGARFKALVHHDDAEREWAYDRKSDVGRLGKALDEANRQRLDRSEHERGLENDFPARCEMKTSCRPIIVVMRL